MQHILDEAEEACKYTDGISFEEFVEDGKTVRAVIRSIDVTGEAASIIFQAKSLFLITLNYAGALLS